MEPGGVNWFTVQPELKLRLNFSQHSRDKMYFAEQQNCLTGRGVLAEWEPCWVSSTDIGTHPPKPPPLVELQRNPTGLRFFLPQALCLLRSSIIAAAADHRPGFSQ